MEFLHTWIFQLCRISALFHPSKTQPEGRHQLEDLGLIPVVGKTPLTDPAQDLWHRHSGSPTTGVATGDEKTWLGRKEDPHMVEDWGLPGLGGDSWH